MDSIAFPDSCSLGDGGDSVQKKKVLNIEEVRQFLKVIVTNCELLNLPINETISSVV